MSIPMNGRGPEDGQGGKPRNKRRFDEKGKKKKERPSVMDRIRSRRQETSGEDDFLDDFDEDIVGGDDDDDVDLDELDDFEDGFDFEDDDDR